MKKVIIMVLGLFSVTGLVSCEDVGNRLNLINHLNTMNELNTYVMEFDSVKHQITGYENDNRFMYIDNVNDTFIISDRNREVITVEQGDVVFELKEESIFGSVYTDIWTKYKLSPEYLDLRYLEKSLFDFFAKSKVTIVDGIYTYRSTTTINALEGKIFNIFEIDFDEEDKDIEFPIIAVYDSEENRFLSFKFDLSALVDRITSNSNEQPTWYITLTFTELNEDFEIRVVEQAFDDHVDDFTLNDFLDIEHDYSFEMINGVINFTTDQDLIQVEFEDDGVYKLKMNKLDNIETLYIQLFDDKQNLIRTFELKSCSDSTSYWQYEEGIYYLKVSGDIQTEDISEYSFLFLSN